MNYAIFIDSRGVTKGYGLLPAWPRPFSGDTAPVAYLLGAAYCRTEEWQEAKGGQKCRVYVAASTAEPVAL